MLQETPPPTPKKSLAERRRDVQPKGWLLGHDPKTVDLEALKGPQWVNIAAYSSGLRAIANESETDAGTAAALQMEADDYFDEQLRRPGTILNRNVLNWERQIPGIYGRLIEAQREVGEAWLIAKTGTICQDLDEVLTWVQNGGWLSANEKSQTLAAFDIFCEESFLNTFKTNLKSKKEGSEVNDFNFLDVTLQTVQKKAKEVKKNLDDNCPAPDQPLRQGERIRHRLEILGLSDDPADLKRMALQAIREVREAEAGLGSLENKNPKTAEAMQKAFEDVLKVVRGWHFIESDLEGSEGITVDQKASYSLVTTGPTGDIQIALLNIRSGKTIPIECEPSWRTNSSIAYKKTG